MCSKEVRRKKCIICQLIDYQHWNDQISKLDFLEFLEFLEYVCSIFSKFSKDSNSYLIHVCSVITPLPLREDKQGI